MGNLGVWWFEMTAILDLWPPYLFRTWKISGFLIFCSQRHSATILNKISYVLFCSTSNSNALGLVPPNLKRVIFFRKCHLGWVQNMLYGFLSGHFRFANNPDSDSTCFFTLKTMLKPFGLRHMNKSLTAPGLIGKTWIIRSGSLLRFSENTSIE